MKKRKRGWLIALVIVLIICLFPVRLTRHDGGTAEYMAVLYRVIVWHMINPDDSGKTNTYLTGTDVYVCGVLVYSNTDWR